MICFYSRQVDIMDWDNLLEVNMSLSKLLVVPNLKVNAAIMILSFRTDRPLQTV